MSAEEATRVAVVIAEVLLRDLRTRSRFADQWNGMHAVDREDMRQVWISEIVKLLMTFSREKL